MIMETYNAIPSSENKDLIDAIEKYVGVQTIEAKRGEQIADILVLPAGKTAQGIKKFLDEYRDRPERREGTATLTTLDSFIEHVNRHKDDNSAVFVDVANTKDPKLVAVIDYNEAGPKAQARFRRHQAIYQFPVSDEWKAWTGCKDQMAQAAFAEFLEERIVDIMDPSAVGKAAKEFADTVGIKLAGPSRIMELSRGLSVRVNSKASNAINLSSGEGQVSFEETHQGQDGGPINIPGGFVIGIPVFRNGAPYSIPVRLRYRVQGGAVVWWFSLQRVDRVWDDAVGEAASAAKDKTGLPVFFGRPE